MKKGKVVARKCSHCGHHEIGIEDENGEYTQLKPGTNIIVYDNEDNIKNMKLKKELKK